jgi:radical SAM protein with 4Fe4S-binding SPASM domain
MSVSASTACGFDAALRGIDLCTAAGIKVGMRFTLTQGNAADLPALLDLMVKHQVDKFYLSHLNYSGRGKRNRKRDAFHQTTRDAMDLLFERAWQDVVNDSGREYVTGNNDADGPYLLQWAEQRMPDHVPALRQRLQQWGGNSSGINIANIDNTGEVHPDTFWWNHHLGNVKERPFSDIWRNTTDPLMLGLRQQPRPLEGRCGKCQYQSICNGNTRVRAYSQTDHYWSEDPGCYLENSEIGLSNIDSTAIPAVEL